MSRRSSRCKSIQPRFSNTTHAYTHMGAQWRRHNHHHRRCRRRRRSPQILPSRKAIHPSAKLRCYDSRAPSSPLPPFVHGSIGFPRALSSRSHHCSQTPGFTIQDAVGRLNCASLSPRGPLIGDGRKFSLAYHRGSIGRTVAQPPGILDVPALSRRKPISMSHRRALRSHPMKPVLRGGSSTVYVCVCGQRCLKYKIGN